MSEASALPLPGATVAPEPRRRDLWPAYLFHAFTAVGPIPLYYYLRSSETLPDQEWVGTTAFDQYFGTGLLYHGSAALCVYLLLKRSARSVWPAWLIVLWVALVQVGGLWRWLNGHEASAILWAGFGVLFLFFLLAKYVQNLRRQGVLHESKS